MAARSQTSKLLGRKVEIIGEHDDAGCHCEVVTCFISPMDDEPRYELQIISSLDSRGFHDPRKGIVVHAHSSEFKVTRN